MAAPATLSERVAATLHIAARAKAAATRDLVADWKTQPIPRGIVPPPDRPARPDRPVLCPPRDVPRRRITASAAGRVALIHAIAHIELNAVDLALDMVSRFVSESSTRRLLP